MQTSTVTDGNYSLQRNNSNNQEWNQTLASFSDSSLYQNYEYGDRFWGEKNCDRLMLKKDGRTAAMTLVRRLKLPMLRISHIRGGPLWRPLNQEPDIVSFDKMLTHLSILYAGTPFQSLRIIPQVYTHEPWAGQIQRCLKDNGFKACNPKSGSAYRTIILPIQNSEEELLKKVDRRWRQKLVKAGKNNHSFKIGSNPETVRSVLEIYNSMLSRKKFEPFIDINHFMALQSELESTGEIKTLLTELDGKPVSFIMFSITGDSAIGLFAGTEQNALRANSSYFSWWKLIGYLRDQGIQSLDLGGINPERNPGVYQFKSGLCGKAGVKTSVIGTYEKHGGPVSRFSLLLLETLRQTRNSIYLWRERFLMRRV